MRIIVTGAVGFIGSHVVDELLKSNHNVLALDNFSTGKFENLSGHSFEHKHLEVINCDITHLPELTGCCLPFKPDIAIHLAAQPAISKSIQDPVFDVTTNAIGTLNIITASQRAGAQRIIFSSTSAVYAATGKKLREDMKLDPQNPYGISKLAAEQYIRFCFPNYVILRFGNVYGPRQVPLGENQVVALMMRHFLHGDEFYIHGDGKQQRDYVYVTDVAEAVVKATRGKSGIYNISGGVGFSVNEIGKFVEQAFSLERYKWDHTDIQDPRRTIQMNINSAQKGLNWWPRTKIQKGVLETAKWWEERL